MKLRQQSTTPEPKPGQVGKFWLSKKPGRKGPTDPWCRTWYADRQMHHISLRTSDLDEASRLLREYVAKNERPEHGSPDQVMVDQVCLAYWEDHAKNIPSARTAKAHLALWRKFWKGSCVSAITPNRQREFRIWLGEGRLAPSTIDKILATGRAALIRAVKWQQLTAAPHIFSVETREQKRSRRPLGRPVTIPEIAAFIDAIRHRNLLFLVLLCANTLARPAALYDMRRIQYDSAHQRLRLNPEGRSQTKKYRPTLPVTPTLRPWLEAETDPAAHLLSYRGRPVSSLSQVWAQTLRDAGLPPDITPYSFRHGMAREMRKRSVPTEQISMFLGHIVVGATATTFIYAPFDPDYCNKAVEVIEAVMAEVRSLLKVGTIDDPLISFGKHPMKAHRKLNDLETTDLRNRLLDGATDAQLSERFGITRAAVRKHRLKVSPINQESACQPRAAQKCASKKIKS